LHCPDPMTNSGSVRGVGRLGMAAATLSLMVAGCGGGHHVAALPPTTSTQPATTTSTEAATSTTTVDPTTVAILAAYRAEWADFLAVAETFPVQPLDPRLAAHATGKQLTNIREFLTTLNLKGHYGVGSVDLAPSVTSMNGDTATVTDCFFDHTVETDGRTHTAIEQPDAGHTLGKATLTLVAGSWLVSDTVTISPGKAQDACTATG
jgi:hypothetical protein